MEKISENDCIKLIRENFPKFIPYWESYTNYWGPDLGLTIQVLPFAEYSIDIIKSGNDNETKKIFDFIEFLLCAGDEVVKTAIATSFLEYILNKDSSEIRFRNFYKFLKINTINYCKAWDEFTGIKTDGLWDDETTAD